MNIKRLFICAAALFSMMMLTGCDLFFDLLENPIYTKITMATSNVTLKGGETVFRQAKTESPAPIIYTSSDEDVAIVDASGLVTAVGSGTATITASVDAIDYWTSAQISYQVTVPADEKVDIPLTIEATQDGTTISVSNNSHITFEYSVNGGSRTTVSGANANISLNQGEYVEFFSNCSSTYSGGDYFNIKPDKTAYVYGNVMSLVDDGTSGFAADKVLDADRALYGLFEGADRLDLHGYKRFELPATTLTSGCYFSMFKGCTRLTRVIPNLLPATTMASDCYQSMFEGCISLAKLPENLLPATSLANACYQSMFKNCISLTSVPENLLPATSLANSCYFRMFENCNKLQKAPVLPANDMVMLCYAYMFTKCRNLQEVTCLATTSQYGSNMGWLDNAGTSVTGTKIFVVNSGFSIDNPTTDMPKDGGAYTVWGSSRSTSSIPALWTVQN